MFKRQYISLTAATCLSLMTLCMSGQVTIGSGIEPVNGALLDLKEQKGDTGGQTAKKGLMLPRMRLSDLNQLYPMFESATTPGQPNGDYNDATKKAAEDARHTGLTVYNQTQCDGRFAQGVYTWTGTQWVQLTKNPILTAVNPSLTFPSGLVADNYLVRIPSGQDARVAWTQAYAPEITFAGTNHVTGTWTNTTTPSTISGGLAFFTNPLLPSDLMASGATWTASPISDIAVWPEAMATADLASNPWLSRESKLVITAKAGTGGPCPGGTDRTQVITLNQTNYKIVPSTSTSTGTGSITPAGLVVLRNTSPSNLPIHSNVGWKATTAATTAQLGKVLSSADLTNATVKGGDKSDGTKYTPLSGSQFDYQSVAVADAVKYESVDVTFVDANTPKRAQDVTVTFFQCQGNEVLSGVTTVANNSATSTTPAPSAWAGKVVKHEAKSGFYEAFYSAEFGAAGRWMTTNLAAWAYDWPSGTPPTLGGVDASSNLTEPRWCYPKANVAVTPGEAAPSTWYSQQGLLYNWPAATGKQNSLKVEQGQVAGSTPGANEVENKAPNGKYQGICPAGWHLPSDREWNQLEKEIYEHPERYSNYQPSQLPFTSTYNSGVGVGSNGTAQAGWRDEWETKNTTNNTPPSVIGGYAWRGSTPIDQIIPGHGLAMIETCGGTTADLSGHSNRIAYGGFSALMVGIARGGLCSGYNEASSYWTSSFHPTQNGYYRQVRADRPGVGRFAIEHTALITVRCKKD